MFDEKLVSRFELLGDPDPAILSTLPLFIAFDVLQAGPHDVRSFPLTKRRVIVEDAIDGAEVVLPVRRLDGNGRRAWATVERRWARGRSAPWNHVLKPTAQQATRMQRKW